MAQLLDVDKRNGSPPTVTGGLRKDVSDLAHDVLTLAELQAQLLFTDVKEGSQNARMPSLLLFFGVIFAVACAPIALVALALFVVEIFTVSYAFGFLIAAVVGAALSGTMCAIGAYRLGNSFKVLNRSRKELECNVRWMKNLLNPSQLDRNQVI